jgi:transcriptional regulator with XRE-family HTH domain
MPKRIATLKSDRVPAPTERTYSSVAEMLAAEGTDRAVQEQFAAAQESTRITRTLAQLRTSAGLTQSEMGKRIGLSQGAVSKLESGRDDDLTLAEIRAYTAHLNARVALWFGPPPTHAEAIKLHAQGMRHSLLELAKLARDDAQMEHAVQKFFGEAFFNLLDIISTCQQSLPNGVSGCTVRMEVHPQVGTAAALGETSHARTFHGAPAPAVHA